MLAISIAGKGARLPHQPINDVAVIDAVVGAPGNRGNCSSFWPPYQTSR